MDMTLQSHFLELPVELLVKIFAKVPYQQRINLMRSSSYLASIYDEHWKWIFLQGIEESSRTLQAAIRTPGNRLRGPAEWQLLTTIAQRYFTGQTKGGLDMRDLWETFLRLKMWDEGMDFETYFPPRVRPSRPVFQVVDVPIAIEPEDLVTLGQMLHWAMTNWPGDEEPFARFLGWRPQHDVRDTIYPSLYCAFLRSLNIIRQDFYALPAHHPTDSGPESHKILRLRYFCVVAFHADWETHLHQVLTDEHVQRYGKESELLKTERIRRLRDEVKARKEEVEARNLEESPP